MLDIQQNALDAICVGIEDYKLAQANNLMPRYKSALRNVFAGMLLLAKTKLYLRSRLGSDGELIRQYKVDLVEGVIKAVPKPNQTVDYGDIQRRFNQLELKLPWGTFNDIQRIRNDVEHYHCNGRERQVQQALANAADIIRQLLTLLDLTPVEALGQENWQTLLDNEDVYKATVSRCQQTLSAVQWHSNTAKLASEEFLCIKCGSSLIKHVGDPDCSQENLKLRCECCGAFCDGEDIMSRTVSRLYFAEAYKAMTQGGEAPTATCPECGFDTFVSDDGKCASCGYESSSGSDADCKICYQLLTLEERYKHPGICSYHLNAVDKDY
jgi:hypothetical protein